MGVSPGFGSFLAFVSGALGVAALASNKWMSTSSTGVSLDLGLARACVSGASIQNFCAFYFVDIPIIAGQKTGWPTTEWEKVAILFSVGTACSFVAWLVGSIASCFACACLCCISVPLSALAALVSGAATAFFIYATVRISAMLGVINWSRFTTAVPAGPVCGALSGPYKFGICVPGWGFWVAAAAAAASFLAFIMFFPTFCGGDSSRGKDSQRA